MCELNNDKERREALDSLPPTLSESYERILIRVKASTPSNQRIVQRALRWIAYVREPLSLRALAEAVSIEIGDEHLDPEAIVDTTAILKWCSSLVRLSSTSYGSPTSQGGISRDDSIIEFAHFTVKEFLLRIDPGDRNRLQAYSLKLSEIIAVDLTRTCLTYLCLDNFAEQYPRNEEDFSKSIKDHPFYWYTANYWMEHGKDHFEDEIISTLSCRLFHLSKSNNFMRWAQQLCKRIAGSKYLNGFVGESLKYLIDSTPLHWACLINAPEICHYLIQEGADVGKNSYLGHPVICAVAGRAIFQDNTNFSASRWGSTPKHALLKLLIEAGASLEVKSSPSINTTPKSLMMLALCCLTSQESALLVSNGIVFDRNALEYLLRNTRKKEEGVECLVNLITIRNLKVEDTTWFMKEASCFKNTSDHAIWEIDTAERVKFNLLNHSSYKGDLNATLRTAAKSGQEGIVKHLIANFGLSVNLENRYDGKSPLHLAVESNFPAMVTLLLDLGANPLQADLTGATPLHLAARLEDAVILKILLEVIKDVGAKDKKGRLALHVAACYGNISAINVLHELNLISKEHRHDTTKDGRTLLMCAAEGGSEEILRFLTDPKTPVSLSETSLDGSTALHYSARSLSASATSYLLQRGFHVDAQKHDKSTALHTVVKSKVGSTQKYQVLKMLLDFKANVNAERADGKTALHLVCESWNSEINYTSLALLLQRGAAVDKIDNDACTPLQRLIYSLLQSRRSDWYSEMSIKDLLERVSDINAEDWRGKSPISLILEGWKSDLKSYHSQHFFKKIFGFLLDHTKSESVRDYKSFSKQPLTLALESKDEGLVDRLLGISCDVDRRDRIEEQYNALEQACHTGCSSDLLTRLIQHSKNKAITSETHNGLNLLHTAVSARHVDLVRVLLDHGFEVNACSKEKHELSALMLAARDSNSKMVKTLLERKADKRLISNRGWTALHYASKRGSLHIAQLLQLDALPSQATAYLNTQRTIKVNGLSPFHLAAYYGQQNLIDYFLATYQDSNVNDMADSDVSALHLAASGGKTPILKHLISIGAIVDATDKAGMSPLHYAAIAGHLNTALVLLEHGADLQLRDHHGMTAEILALLNSHQDLAKTLSDHKITHQVMPMNDSSLHPSGNNACLEESSLTEAVFQAILREDLHLCKKLIDAGANINGIDRKCGRCTPLLAALGQQQVDVVELLIHKGALDEGNTCDQHFEPGYSAIHIATSYGYAEVLRKLLRKNRTCDRLSAITPVQLAAKKGHLDCLKVLLDFDATKQEVDPASSGGAKASIIHSPRLDQRNEDITKDQNNLDRTSPHVLIESQTHERSIGNTASEALENLVETAIHPWDLKQPELVPQNDDLEYSSALHLATTSNFEDVVDFLIHQGAHLEARDIDGYTALHIAAKMGHLEITQRLINSGANVDARDEVGRTAAMLAARDGHLDMLRILFNSNANFTVKDHDGRHALDHATFSVKVETVSYLMALGQKICWSPRGVCLPLCRSLDRGSPELQNFLLDFMPDYAIECSRCGPLLQSICRFQQVELLRKYTEKLREHGLLNMINRSDETFPPALCLAASLGAITQMQILLEAGADIEISWGYYGTPLGAACLAGRLDAVKYLIERGAKSSWTESDGKLVTMIEKAKGHKHILRWLQKREDQSEVKYTTGVSPTLSNKETAVQAERYLPRLGKHRLQLDVVNQAVSMANQFIRRRSSFILDYALRGTTIPSVPIAHEAQSSPRHTNVTRVPPDWGATIREQNVAVYESAAYRNSDFIPPRHYEMYPLIKKTFRVDPRSPWELF